MTNQPTSALPVGSTLHSGEYRIEKVLGQGSFGITYLGLQVGLNRHVAIREFFMKELCSRNSQTSAVTVDSIGSRETVNRFRAKFVKEAQMIGALDDSHIIRIYDLFEENDTAYYVMQYIEGGSLNELVKEQGKLSEADALNYIRQLGEALRYIHGENILHLNIKPSNIMLRKGSEIVLIDFGMSKHYDEGDGQASTTLLGISKGYAPIEQYRQGDTSQFAPSTDIYSLGATFYKLLTGHTPPEAADLYDKEIDFPNEIAPHLRAVITKAMAANRKTRYQSADEFLAALVDGNDRPNSIAGHEYVDLGLSVKWATCNVGANLPARSGNHYAWGETSPAPECKYTQKNCRLFKQKVTDIGGDATYDAARANWGGSWRLPIKDEFQELIDNCDWEWTAQDGKNGYKVTSKKNGASIFLPAAGLYAVTSFYNNDQKGSYWTSSGSVTKYAC